MSASLALIMAGCGGVDDAVSTDGDSVAAEVTEPMTDPEPTEPDVDHSAPTGSDTPAVTSDDGAKPDSDGSAGSATAIVTFVDDGSTREFVLDECITSDTTPGNFVEVGPDGAMSVHGRDDGWELQLSVLSDANGDLVNFSYLTDGGDVDYQLGDLVFAVSGNSVTASADADIYQTFDVEESIPLTFDVAC